MEFERTTMAQFSEIERLLQAGHTDRQIARALKCRRTLVASVRKKEVGRDLISRAKQPENKLPPVWALRVDWDLIEKDIREVHHD